VCVRAVCVPCVCVCACACVCVRVCRTCVLCMSCQRLGRHAVLFYPEALEPPKLCVCTICVRRVRVCVHAIRMLRPRACVPLYRSVCVCVYTSHHMHLSLVDLGREAVDLVPQLLNQHRLAWPHTHTHTRTHTSVDLLLRCG
jgi:hypothetical protein